MSERPKILIVSGYHPKETFAVEVGEYLFRNNSNSAIKVVRYTGGIDSGPSNYRLRRFIEKFNPELISIILHGDDDTPMDVVIISFVRSRKERMKILSLLFDLYFKYRTESDILVIGDARLKPNTKHSLIELELNSKMGLQESVKLVESFSQCLLKSL